MLDALHGRAVGEPYEIAPPSRSYLEEAGRDPAPLRIGVIGENWASVPVEGAISAALADVTRLLATLGHGVEGAELDIGVSWDAFVAANATMWNANLVNWCQAFSAASGRPIDDTVLEPSTLACYEHGLGITAADRRQMPQHQPSPHHVEIALRKGQVADVTDQCPDARLHGAAPDPGVEHFGTEVDPDSLGRVAVDQATADPAADVEQPLVGKRRTDRRDKLILKQADRRLARINRRPSPIAVACAQCRHAGRPRKDRLLMRRTLFTPIAAHLFPARRTGFNARIFGRRR